MLFRILVLFLVLALGVGRELDIDVDIDIGDLVDIGIMLSEESLQSKTAKDIGCINDQASLNFLNKEFNTKINDE